MRHRNDANIAPRWFGRIKNRVTQRTETTRPQGPRYRGTSIPSAPSRTTTYRDRHRTERRWAPQTRPGPARHWQEIKRNPQRVLSPVAAGRTTGRPPRWKAHERWWRWGGRCQGQEGGNPTRDRDGPPTASLRSRTTPWRGWRRPSGGRQPIPLPITHLRAVRQSALSRK